MFWSNPTMPNLQKVSGKGTTGQRDPMSAQDKLNPQQFNYFFDAASPNQMAGRTTHELQMFHGNERIGEMLWHHGTGEIQGINIRPEHRRQGAATTLLGHARQLAENTRGVTRPRHSADRTTAGDAWARSLGERLPRRVQG
jgi:ribosomal protein S18 acetylase RimI-like enzyme